MKKPLTKPQTDIALDLEQTSVLAVGARGHHRGKDFEIIGRTCILSDGGGLWNEHRVIFEDGIELTLAEAHGGFAIYAEAELPEVPKGKGPGEWVDDYVVIVERGKATRAATWGSVAKAPKTYRYLDLSSKKGDLATIAELKYRGTRVALADLELAVARPHPKFFPAPTSKKGARDRLAIAIGAEGKLAGTKWRVIGALGRENDGFRWHEYVLHDAAMGFRFLVFADDTWILVSRIEAGLVKDEEETARYAGEKYEYSSGGTARVEWAVGELPWQCAIGDTAVVHDFERGKQVLSFESTDDEISWSHGETVKAAAVTKAFSDKKR